jgi:hypothetical protein
VRPRLILTAQRPQDDAQLSQALGLAAAVAQLLTYGQAPQLAVQRLVVALLALVDDAQIGEAVAWPRRSPSSWKMARLGRRQSTASP